MADGEAALAESTGRVQRRHPVTAKLDEFADLEDGWDSYGSPRPNPHAIDAARSLFICPTNRGGIAFEWENGDECVLFALGPDGLVEDFYIRANGNEFEWERAS